MASFGLIICFLSTFVINFSLITAQPPTYRYHFCLGGNYTANSTFDSNLNVLLSSLSSNGNANSINRNGFYNSTAGRNTDTVYGALQCRGDVTSQECRTCADTATQDIRKEDRCPVSKQAFIWYDVCMLRYSNESFFSIMQENPRVYLWNPNNVTNPARFNQILSDLLDDIISEAVSRSLNNTLFATGDRNFTTFQQVYGLVQCTSDIDPFSCNRCLRSAITEIPTCCDGKQGGRVMKPSCNFRYETYPFYQSKASTPPTALPPSPPRIAPLPPSPSTNTTSTKGKGKSSTKIALYITIPVAIVGFISTIVIWFLCFRRKKIPKKFDNVDEIQSAESLQFHLSTVKTATDNFSDANKLGEGGFGSVYKGVLPGGEEIAVKRLSRSSGQGEEQFKNEVILLAKLQHRNLVRLLGFCLDGEEKLLIYEFLSNGSLDQLLFDPVKCTSLAWETRYKIIGEIARGLLYLHEDSRHRIIHRDLKTSNILLGADMNPKISDFGMARLFVVDQTQGNTSRVVGTYGYMSPEYAMHGQFSVKSDVFSYGVLVLEIISGQKISRFYESERAEDLLSYAWRYWKEGKAFELLNPSLREHCSRSEVMRCVHICLLCVQEDVADRPTMASIVLMLNSYSVTLPLPSPPAFFVQSRNDPKLLSEDSETVAIKSDQSTPWTINDMSITELHPR